MTPTRSGLTADSVLLTLLVLGLAAIVASALGPALHHLLQAAVSPLDATAVIQPYP